MMTKFEDPQIAFNRAISAGRLSLDPEDDNFVSHYMYMGVQDGKDLFKHMATREYIN
jgi:hypothetical protein